MVSVGGAMWLLSAAVYSQSGIAGTWIGQDQSPRGATQVVVQLRVNGSELAGTVTMGESPTQGISDGKVKGRAVSFKTATVLNGKEVPIFWEGEATDAQLTLARTFGAGGRELPPLVLDRSE
jgi:hypothetical protein